MYEKITGKLGKPIHSDESNDKSTFVTLYGIDKCKVMVDELTKKAKNALKIFPIWHRPFPITKILFLLAYIISFL